MEPKAPAGAQPVGVASGHAAPSGHHVVLVHAQMSPVERSSPTPALVKLPCEALQLYAHLDYIWPQSPAAAKLAVNLIVSFTDTSRLISTLAGPYQYFVSTSLDGYK